MIEITRVGVAYGIIALVAVIAIPVAIKLTMKRRRTKLRRNGIKRYGH